MLVGLLLPAVQAARGSARRAHCAGNLRQLGLALHGYLGAWQLFPAGVGGRGQSLHAALLPFLEQSALFSAINFDVVNPIHPANATVWRTSVALFLCPSDYRPTDGSWTSYAGNVGDIARPATTGLFDYNDSGPPPRPARYIGLQDVTDGSSSTAAMAEWCINPRSEEDPVDPTRDVYAILGRPSGSPDDIADFVAHCDESKNAVVNGLRKGEFWLVGAWIGTLYDHGGTPGGRSCYTLQATNWAFVGSCTASSRHPAGVHLLLADGHVRLVRRGIEAGVWRALGSRNGAEVISDRW